MEKTRIRCKTSLGTAFLRFDIGFSDIDTDYRPDDIEYSSCDINYTPRDIIFAVGYNRYEIFARPVLCRANVVVPRSSSVFPILALFHSIFLVSYITWTLLGRLAVVILWVSPHYCTVYL